MNRIGDLTGTILRNYLFNMETGGFPMYAERELPDWAADMIELGHDGPALCYIAAGIEQREAFEYFEKALAELGIVSCLAELNEDIIEKVCLEEYRRGYRSAYNLLRVESIRVKSGFPYHLNNGKYSVNSKPNRIFVGWYSAERGDFLEPLKYGEELEKIVNEYAKRYSDSVT
ncbi:MAG: hypothetical protein K2N72_04785 [Oscillospiraceae bacterium]|nr:hypothetical protein [Oscillospiraceae bacterium]